MLKNLHVTALGLSLVAVAASSAAGCLGQASDENASDEQNAALTDNCASATAWKAGIAVTAGSFVSYQGRLYKVLTSHTTQADWPPNAVPALFQDVGSCTGTGTSTSTSGAGGNTGTSTSSSTTSTTTGAGGGGGAGGGSTGAGGSESRGTGSGSTCSTPSGGAGGGGGQGGGGGGGAGGPGTLSRVPLSTTAPP